MLTGWLRGVTEVKGGYRWLRVVTGGFMWLWVVTRRFGGLQVAALGCQWLCVFFLSNVYLTLRVLASQLEIEMTKRNRFMSMGMTCGNPGGISLQGIWPCHCMVLQGFAWYCMSLHGIALYCMVLHGIA